MTSILQQLVMMTWYPEHRRSVESSDTEPIPEYLLKDGLWFICQGEDVQFKKESLLLLTKHSSSPLLIEAIASECLKHEGWTEHFYHLGMPWIEAIARQPVGEGMHTVYLELRCLGSPLQWHLALKLLQWRHYLLAELAHEATGPECIKFGREMINWLRKEEFIVERPFEWIPQFIARLMPNLKPNLISALRHVNAKNLSSVELILQIGLTLDHAEWDDKILNALDPGSCIAFPELVLQYRTHSKEWVKSVIRLMLQQDQCPAALVEYLDSFLFDTFWLEYLSRCSDGSPIIRQLAMQVELILAESRSVDFISNDLLPWLLARHLDADAAILLARTVAYCIRSGTTVTLSPKGFVSAQVQMIYYEELLDWVDVDAGLLRLVKQQYLLSAGRFAEIDRLESEHAFDYVDWNTSDCKYWINVTKLALPFPSVVSAIAKLSHRLGSVDLWLCLWNVCHSVLDQSVYDDICLALLRCCSLKRMLEPSTVAMQRLFEVFMANPFPDQVPDIIYSTLSYDSSSFIPLLLSKGHFDAAIVLTAAYPNCLGVIWPVISKRFNLQAEFVPVRIPSPFQTDNVYTASLHLLTALSPSHVDQCLQSFKANAALWSMVLEHLPWDLAWILPNKLLA